MIQQKLLEIQKTVRALKADASGYNYKYLSGDKLLSVVRPKMDELGVLLTPEILGVELRELRTQKWDNRAQAPVEQFNLLYILSMRMTWVDTEDGSTLAMEWKAAGENTIDKGYGSALTYGERYFLMKFFHLATDEDDVDAKQEASEDDVDAKPRERKPAPGPGARRRAKDPAPADEPAAQITIEEAIAQVGAVKSYAELLDAWARLKPLYGKDPRLIKAIATNPYNERSNGAEK